jgi:antitoxin component YwqK of YwqJK toxin-antitoxin module
MKIYACFCLVILISACTGRGKEKRDADLPPGAVIVREYHSNGKIKTEITAVGQLRNGPTRNYDRMGRLLSEVNYVNNVKEGLATNYYAASGKINSTIEYKNGIKNGDETWYYESGKPYRITPYVDGKINGIQRLLYENGQPLAEIPYKEGFPGEGLKEYKPDGSLVDDYPRLIIIKEDHLANANKILLIISLSNKSQDVKYYKGQLTEGKYINAKMLLLATQTGSTQLDFNVPPGSMLSQSVTIAAVCKTPRGNPFVTHKTTRLQFFNAN